MAPLDEPITDLLQAWSQGDEKALGQVLPKVYDRLREIASGFLLHERSEHTLQSAALVHEAYLRLLELNRIQWNDRAHFFALSARLMRRILVDHARRHDSAKRDPDAERVPFEPEEIQARDKAPDLVALDLALCDLARKDPQMARIVELRYFGGLARDDIAEVLGISSATVTRRWRVARAWLLGQMNKNLEHGG